MTSVVVATWLVRLVSAYLACGLVFAIPFLTRGAARIDPGAREGTWGFRLMVLPGVAALWPLLLRRWLGGRGEPPSESNAHRRAAARAARVERGS